MQPELQHLRVQISTAPVEWIEKFLVAGGGKALSGLLQRLLGKKKGYLTTSTGVDE